MKKTSLSWISLFLVTFLAAYLFIFNEWLFAVTKPSFLNSLDFPQQLDIFFATGATLASLCFLGLLPLVTLSIIPPLKRHMDILIRIGGLLPAGIFTILILMMVDNFTYTVTKWGIVSTEGWIRGLYGLCFIMLIVVCYRRILKALTHLSRRTRIWGIAQNRLFTLMICVLLLSIAILVFPDRPQASSLSTTNTSNAMLLPNILLITSDGVNANHMSVYGYERDTTPRLRQLAQSALVAENAFPNFGRTGGSIVSLYTGKYPAETHFLAHPDVLKGADSYEHLPGILHSLGYRTVQITMPYYLDPDTLNLAEGFDEVKTLQGAVHSKYLGAISKVLPNDKALFIDEVANRILDRIKHIFFIQKMINPYLFVVEMAEPLLDIERREIIEYEMNTSGQPVFIHVHLMGTHGPKFNVTEQKYSAGQSIVTQPLWTDDFYDDSILEFDKNVGELIDYLTELDLLDSTVLIIGSDHGQQWDLLKRLPLMIRFPHGEYTGKIQANVQNLDIAPTVLDYIGLEQPGWMRGSSLIAGELEQRFIYGMTISRPKGLSINDSLVTEEDASSLSDKAYLNTLIHCHKWFMLDSYNMSWETGFIEGSTATCPTGSEITDEQAFRLIVEHLKANGFDVSNLAQLSP